MHMDLRFATKLEPIEKIEIVDTSYDEVRKSVIKNAEEDVNSKTIDMQ